MKSQRKPGRRDVVTKSDLTRVVKEAQLQARQLKYFDVEVVGSVTATASYNVLTSVAQGVAQSQRIGDKVRVVKIDIHLSLVTANSDVYNTVRLVWFRWTPNTAALTPGATSILENPTTQGTRSHYNYEGRKEYHILKDMFFGMTGTSTNPTPGSLRVERMSIRCDHDVVYNLGATTGCNHVYGLVLSDSAITPYPEIDYWARVWYLD